MKTAVAVAALILGIGSAAWAQSAGTVGGGASSPGSAVVGSGGSAAAGGTSATTLGTGGTSTGEGQTSSTIGSGGSAAAAGGDTKSSTRIHENPQMLHGRSSAQAQDGGTWSKSRTRTKVRSGEGATSTTRSMSHEPGGPPAKSTTTESVDVPR